jgi:transposase InsO family protein
MAIWARRDELEGLVHHSDRGSQYLSIRYTERLAEAGAVTSVGSRGDSYDNALAETIIGLYKTELIRRRGPWKGIDQVEYTTLEWVDWFNHRRLLEPSGTSRRPSSRPPTTEGGSQPHYRTQGHKPPVNPGRFRDRSDTVWCRPRPLLSSDSLAFRPVELGEGSPPGHEELPTNSNDDIGER